MTLEKAIEILKLIHNTPPSGATPDFTDAVELGSEALKREQLLRHEIPYDREGLLPGETEE